MIHTELIQDLIRCKPVSSNIPAVNQATEIMHNYLESNGLYCTLEEFEGRKILFASTVPGKTPDVLLNAHLDVVPAASDSQFVPEERDGKIFGRGSADCLGNAVVLAQVLIALKGKASAGAIFTADEEIGGNTTRYMVEQGYSAGKIILILDGSPFVIVRAQKGILELRLRANSKGGHSCKPWCFQNPIDMLMDGYLKLRSAWNEITEDKWCNTMTPCVISGGFAYNQIPDTAEMVVNIRYIKAEDAEKIIRMAKDLTGLEVTVEAQCVPVEVDENTPILQTLRGKMQSFFTDQPISFVQMHGATDARHFVATGTPIAVLGTVGNGVHAADEWTSIQVLDDYREMLTRFITEL